MDVVMPQMGESIAEGTLSRWLKKVGDEVKRDEPIFEISTDKVDAEIPSPSSGVLAEILVGEGKTVAVQTVVARIETEKGASIAPAPAPAPTAAPAVPVAVVAPVTPVASAAAAPAVTVPATARPAAAPGALPHSFEERVRTRSSPLVRRMAAEHGVEIAALAGSGIAGRVTKKDLESFLANGGAAPAPALSATHLVPADTHAPSATPWPGDVVEPMSKIRRLTSDHMALAIRVATHVTTVHEVDLTRLARVRARMRGEFEATTGQKLSFLPFIIHAVVGTLKRHPIMNAVVNGTDIIYRKRYNIGVAVALDPTGLIVPVIKNAEDLSLSGLTKATNDLALRARTKRLNPTEVQDATFTISNYGTFGSIFGTPIIPVGTTAILGLGAIEKRAKVVTGPDGEDTIAIRTCAYFSYSFDHKVVDGADADRFMADLKKTLEQVPESGF
ncbi:MAG: dihydrolipoamide acetyltransferase family protein [Gemmatimonadota bacterium]|nr:dihydrolipoamide acetyltransferase family protein [Gemmatimonadota bacterium]